MEFHDGFLINEFSNQWMFHEKTLSQNISLLKNMCDEEMRYINSL